MISGAALNTYEVLERIPGVTVNNTGDISLNSRGGVLVMIDGRAMYMSAPDLAAYMKSIPAGNLDKIELIDNPSSKYDASGNAIINIKLRRNRAAGFTGNINSGFSQGTYARTNNSINLNYNRRKLNIYTNLGFNTAREYSKDEFHRKYFNTSNNLVSSIMLNNYQLNTSNNLNIYSVFDYGISPKSTIGATFNYNEGRREGDFDFTGQTFDATNNKSNVSSGYTHGIDKRKNINVNVNYLHQYNSNGHELSADFNYLDHHSGSERLQENFIYTNDHTLLFNDRFQYIVPVNSNIYVFKADYVYPMKSKIKVEAGLKSSYIINDNISDYYDLNGPSPVFGPGNSNHFQYKENINAAYFNVGKMWKRLQGQFGLRMENLQATGRQLGNDVVEKSEFSKSSTELFPSAFLLYKLDTLNKNSISVIAVRRINRPNYFQLNPFVFVRDEFTNTTGNPDLDPQFQYRLEVKYQHKKMYWFGLSYNKFTQVIFNTTEVVNEKYITRPYNLAKGFMILLNTGLTVSPAKWWNSNNVLRMSRMGLRSTLYGEQLNPDAFVVRMETINFFTISKSLSAELGAYYASKDLNGQAFSKQIFRSNVAVQKKIMNDKGAVRAGVDDIFHSWKYRNRSVGLKQSSYYHVNEMDTQRFSVSFSYRFGKDSNNRKRKQNNANEEEKGRLE